MIPIPGFRRCRCEPVQRAEAAEPSLGDDDLEAVACEATVRDAGAGQVEGSDVHHSLGPGVIFEAVLDKDLPGRREGHTQGQGQRNDDEQRARSTAHLVTVAAMGFIEHPQWVATTRGEVCANPMFR